MAEGNTGIVQLPEHGSCYVCGTSNPRGLGVTWYAEERGAAGPLIFARLQFRESEQGPPGHAHGGASAAVLDEAMGAAVWRSGLKVVLANLNLDYRAPLPLHVTVRAEAWFERSEGRKAFAVGRLLLPDGRVAVEGRGLYVHAPQLFPFDYFG